MGWDEAQQDEPPVCVGSELQSCRPSNLLLLPFLPLHFHFGFSRWRTIWWMFRIWSCTVSTGVWFCQVLAEEWRKTSCFSLGFLDYSVSVPRLAVQDGLGYRRRVGLWKSLFLLKTIPVLCSKRDTWHCSRRKQNPEKPLSWCCFSSVWLFPSKEWPIPGALQGWEVHQPKQGSPGAAAGAPGLSPMVPPWQQLTPRRISAAFDVFPYSLIKAPIPWAMA